MTQMTETALLLLSATPLAAALGLAPLKVEAGHVAMAMPYDTRLIGDPATGVIHGGAISVLMDTAGAGSVLTSAADIVAVATLDLRIDYMRPATPGRTIVARAHCAHLTRHVGFVRITATDDPDDNGCEAGGRPVATGTGVFAVERGEGREGRGGTVA